MMRRLPDLREIRTLVLVVLLAGLGINLTVLFLVNLPQAGRLGAAGETVRDLREKLDVRRAEITEMHGHLAWIEKRATALAAFYDEVLAAKGERMVAIQREIHEITGRYGIDPTSIAYSHEPAEKDTNLIRFSASLPLKGSYPAMRSFIRDIEKSRNFLLIDRIDLTNSREGGVLLSLQIQVSTIFKDPEYDRFEEKG